MFKSESYRFEWHDLGDIEKGRPSLGALTSVAVYRLMQYTLRETLNRHLSAERSSEILREAGKLAGAEFCKNALDRSQPFNEFMAELQERLLTLKIGILRIEKSNLDTREFVLTVSEDLDCSGLPPTDETVCEYDEGFLSGVFEAYTGHAFEAREVDCWASGERACRFEVRATS